VKIERDDQRKTSEVELGVNLPDMFYPFESVGLRLRGEPAPTRKLMGISLKDGANEERVIIQGTRNDMIEFAMQILTAFVFDERDE
jgi:hypothetical protein